MKRVSAGIVAVLLLASAGFAAAGEAQTSDAGDIPDAGQTRDAGAACKEPFTRPQRVPQAGDANGGATPHGQGAEGRSIIKCTITVEGRVEDCSVLKSVGAKTDQAVLLWLSQQRYTPVIWCVKRQAVSYVFNFRFKNGW